jgi:hypothetical protein
MLPLIANRENFRFTIRLLDRRRHADLAVFPGLP